MRISDTALIVPAHNESRVIVATLTKALESFTHVVCVDDGSTDDTADLARTTGAKVLSHPVNVGQGAAIQTGIEYARRLPVDLFVTFDADGQHRTEDVLAMRETLLREAVDIVLGSRFLGTSKSVPRMKRLLLRAAVVFSNLTSGLRLTDAHNGLRVFNRQVAETIDLQEPGYRHASEFTEKIARHRYTYREAPVVIEYSRYSMAKGQSALNAVNILVDTVTAKAISR